MRSNFILIVILSFLGSNESFTQTNFDIFQYRYVGPTRGGRVTSVTGVATQPNTFYMGATGGGVWKTQDYGTSWQNISDGFFETPSIGAIQVAQNDANIIYVGTGSDGLRSNVITGKGVYKSINAGKTWKHIGLKKVGQIGAVEIHPQDHNTVFVAAIGQAFSPNKERGVFRTKDGGTTWKNVLHISDTTGIVDLEFMPTNPNIIYAAAWRGERKPWTIISGGKERSDSSLIALNISSGSSLHFLKKINLSIIMAPAITEARKMGYINSPPFPINSIPAVNVAIIFYPYKANLFKPKLYFLYPNKDGLHNQKKPK